MVAPATLALAQAMIKSAALDQRQTIVEFGPGTGVVTAQIEKLRQPDSSFFSIELNPKFAELTRVTCPSVTVHIDNAVNLGKYLGTEQCDAIISSLPWTLINANDQATLMDTISENLAPGGVFVTYLYSGAGIHPSGRRFLKLLKSRFQNHHQSSMVWNNLPPARVHTVHKPN